MTRHWWIGETAIQVIVAKPKAWTARFIPGHPGLLIIGPFAVWWMRRGEVELLADMVDTL